MFSCSKCSVMESEVKFLREEVRRLLDRLLAVTNPYAYQAVQSPLVPPEDCYGSSTDEMIEYDPITGQRILVTKKNP